jgi:hypothetical protein
MRQLARVTMTMRDLDRLKCIQAVVDGNLKPARADRSLVLRIPADDSFVQDRRTQTVPPSAEIFVLP